MAHGGCRDGRGGGFPEHRLFSSPVLQESFLQELGQGLTDEYYQLGLKLHVPDHLMNQIELCVKDKVVNYPLLMLKKWTQGRAYATIVIWKDELCKGLKLTSRNDLVRLTQQIFQQQRLSGPEQMKQDICSALGEHLSRDWYKLGIYLEVPSSVLDQIRMTRPPEFDARVQTLLEWRKSSSNQNDEAQMVLQLEGALQNIRRNDLVHKVRQKRQENSVVVDQATAESLQLQDQQNVSVPSGETFGEPTHLGAGVTRVTTGVQEMQLSDQGVPGSSRVEEPMAGAEQQVDGSELRYPTPRNQNDTLGPGVSDNLSLTSTLGRSTQPTTLIQPAEATPMSHYQHHDVSINRNSQT